MITLSTGSGVRNAAARLTFGIRRSEHTCITDALVSLQEVVYEKSIGTNMKDLDLCLEVV